MTGERRRYSAEFEAKVSLDALKGDLTVAELVAKYGVHQTLINTWKRQVVEGMSAGTREPARLSEALVTT